MEVAHSPIQKRGVYHDAKGIYWRDVCRRCMLGAAQYFDVCCGSDGKGEAEIRDFALYEVE